MLEGLDGRRESARLAANDPLYPASMIKVPIALALAEACRTGVRRLDETVVVTPENLTASDAPSPFVAGARAELGALAAGMLADSDNVATNVLIDVLERAAITRVCRTLGLRNTAVHRKLSGALPLIDDPGATGRNAHPAGDAADLFRRLSHREPDTRFVLDALAAQRWNDKLSGGLRPGDRFAHKTGDTDEVSHDGGILELGGGRRYVLVVYTTLPANPETSTRFANFARALRPHLD